MQKKRKPWLSWYMGSTSPELWIAIWATGSRTRRNQCAGVTGRTCLTWDYVLLSSIHDISCPTAFMFVASGDLQGSLLPHTHSQQQTLLAEISFLGFFFLFFSISAKQVNKMLQMEASGCALLKKLEKLCNTAVHDFINYCRSDEKQRRHFKWPPNVRYGGHH